MALLCDKQPPNNNGIENFVVLKQVEKWKRSRDFILSFGLIQNHFLIKEFPRPFRTNLSSFFLVWEHHALKHAPAKNTLLPS